MRFMILVKASQNTEAGIMPSRELLEEMGKFNEELVKAGVMKAGEGLRPSSKAARVHFSGSNRSVTPGPFSGERGLICGYWIWEAKSMDEAINWARRCPNPTGQEGELEIRQLMELEDFGPELSAELCQREKELRRQTQGAAACK